MFPFPFSFIGSVVPDVPVEQIANAEAMSFNGTDQYVAFPDISLSGEFTLSFWMNPVNFNVVIIGDDISNDWLRINSSTVIDLDIANNKTTWTSGVTFTTGEWQHVVLRRDSSNVCTIFRNGVHYTNNSPTKGGTFGPLNKIGQKANGNYFNGELDEVALFNTALSASKIQEIYDATAVVDGVPQTANLFTGGLDSSLVYWNRMGDS